MEYEDDKMQLITVIKDMQVLWKFSHKKYGKRGPRDVAFKKVALSVNGLGKFFFTFCPVVITHSETGVPHKCTSTLFFRWMLHCPQKCVNSNISKRSAFVSAVKNKQQHDFNVRLVYLLYNVFAISSFHNFLKNHSFITSVTTLKLLSPRSGPIPAWTGRAG